MSDRTCAVEGCDKPVLRRDWCQGHYVRWRKHGDVDAARPLRVPKRRSVMNTGYVRVWCPGHPMANSDGYALEHRKVAFDAGLVIYPGDHVHHINEDRADNRIENLEVIDEAEHHRRHVQAAGFVVNQYGTWPLRDRRAS